MVAMTASAAMGQVHELDALRLDQALAVQAEDSLIRERARLLQLGAQVSETIDSLKQADPGSAALTERSLYAMELNTGLGRVNQQLEGLAGRHDSLKVQLRAAYDWEIARLLGLLGEGWDEGLLEQLAIYHEERQSLGFELAAAEMRYGPDMTVADDDGPEEIDAKAELMRDKLRMVRRDLDLIDRRIGYLSEQVEIVSSLVGLHSAAPRGQPAMRDRRTARLSTEGETRTTELESATAAPVRRGSQASLGGEAARLSGPRGTTERDAIPAVQGLQLQISRLRARQQEIRQFEAVYVNRIAAFERRRQSLLTAGN